MVGFGIPVNTQVKVLFSSRIRQSSAEESIPEILAGPTKTYTIDKQHSSKETAMCISMHSYIYVAMQKIIAGMSEKDEKTQKTKNCIIKTMM